MSNDKERVSNYMVCAISHMLKDEETVFHGVSSHIPMIAMMLARATHAENLVHVDIPGGVNPSDVSRDDYSSAGLNIYKNASSYFPLSDVFDLAMRGELDTAFLSGVQFDLEGNVNASVIGEYEKPKVRLPGGAGSAVLIPTARKVILWRTKHDRRTFSDHVDFVTTRGNTWRMVTPLCIFAFQNGRWELDRIHPTSSLSEIEEKTGFPLYYDEVRYTEEPTREELRLLDRIDPHKNRLLEFQSI